MSEKRPTSVGRTSTAGQCGNGRKRPSRNSRGSAQAEKRGRPSPEQSAQDVSGSGANFDGIPAPPNRLWSSRDDHISCFSFSLDPAKESQQGFICDGCTRFCAQSLGGRSEAHDITYRPKEYRCEKPWHPHWAKSKFWGSGRG